MTDTTIPPMPTGAPTVSAAQPDWLDRLLAGEFDDDSAVSPPAPATSRARGRNGQFASLTKDAEARETEEGPETTVDDAVPDGPDPDTADPDEKDSAVPQGRRILKKMASRLPDWRTGQTIDLGNDGAEAAGDTGTGDAHDEEAPGEDPEEGEAGDAGDEPSVAGEPGEPAPARRSARFDPRRVRDYVVAEHGDQAQRLRKLAYNSTAAGLGWGLGLEAAVRTALQAGMQFPAETLALLLASGVVIPAWRAIGRAANVLPFPAASRPLLTVGATWFAAATAPALLAEAVDHGIPLDAIALLTTSGGLCGLGWLIVRRTRGWWAPLAWAGRMPLATALVAIALYTPTLTY